MVKAKCSRWISSAVMEILLLQSTAPEWGRQYQSYVAITLHVGGWLAQTGMTEILIPAL